MSTFWYQWILPVYFTSIWKYHQPNGIIQYVSIVAEIDSENLHCCEVICYISTYVRLLIYEGQFLSFAQNLESLFSLRMGYCTTRFIFAAYTLIFSMDDPVELSFEIVKKIRFITVL